MLFDKQLRIRIKQFCCLKEVIIAMEIKYLEFDSKTYQPDRSFVRK